MIVICRRGDAAFSPLGRVSDVWNVLPRELLEWKSKKPGVTWLGISEYSKAGLGRIQRERL